MYDSNDCIFNSSGDCKYCLVEFCSNRKQSPQTFITSNTSNTIDELIKDKDIYIVTCSDFIEEHIVKAFRNENEADAFIKEHESDENHSYYKYRIELN